VFPSEPTATVGQPELAAALAGDTAAFRAFTHGYRRELHLHFYRPAVQTLPVRQRAALVLHDVVFQGSLRQPRYAPQD
jgi:hypothetical protein